VRVKKKHLTVSLLENNKWRAFLKSFEKKPRNYNCFEN
jgi:hypothetical protein